MFDIPISMSIYFDLISHFDLRSCRFLEEFEVSDFLGNGEFSLQVTIVLGNRLLFS